MTPSLNHISRSLSRRTPIPPSSQPSHPEPQRLQAVLLAEGTETDNCGAKNGGRFRTLVVLEDSEQDARAHLMCFIVMEEEGGAGGAGLSLVSDVEIFCYYCLSTDRFVRV